MARKRKTKAKPTLPDVDSTKPCRLLELPPELRNRIFELVCANTTMQYRRQSHLPSNGMPKPPGYVLACKQIHYESIQVLYASAAFKFTTLFRLRSWIRNISGAKLAMTKRVSLHDFPPIKLKLLKREKKRNGLWRTLQGEWTRGESRQIFYAGTWL